MDVLEVDDRYNRRNLTLFPRTDHALVARWKWKAVREVRIARTWARRPPANGSRYKSWLVCGVLYSVAIDYNQAERNKCH